MLDCVPARSLSSCRLASRFSSEPGQTSESPAPQASCGIHGVETLYAFMGAGCRSLKRVATSFSELIAAQWEHGRSGSVRGYLKGAAVFGFNVIGEDDHRQQMVSEEYIHRELLKRVINMFETGETPVQIEEMLESIAFIEAALSTDENCLSLPTR